VKEEHGWAGIESIFEDRDFVTLSTTTPGSTRTVGSNYFKGVNFTSISAELITDLRTNIWCLLCFGAMAHQDLGLKTVGNFPAGSVGWRISEENFLQGSSG
jgi:hypothetical protein